MKRLRVPSFLLSVSEGRRALLLALAGFSSLIVFFSGPVRAQIVIGTEDAVNGFVGPLVGPIPQILVASDGEAPFTPFGVTFDTTDAIQFPTAGAWAWDPRFPQGLWQQTDANTWALQAVAENEPNFSEDVGHWFSTSGTPWTPGTPPLQIINAPDESVSDVIVLDNTGPTGGAAITFASDPFAVPEPTTAILFVVGLMGMFGYHLLKRYSLQRWRVTQKQLLF